MTSGNRVSLDLTENYISEKLSGKQRDGSSEIRSGIVRELMCGGLTKRQREYLILRYTKKMSGAEIARMYGVSRSSVSITLSRARRRITKLLGTQKMREDYRDYLLEH